MKRKAKRQVKRKPGRPVSNLRVRELMKKHKCSRQWAYELYRRERRLKAVIEKCLSVNNPQ